MSGPSSVARCSASTHSGRSASGTPPAQGMVKKVLGTPSSRRKSSSSWNSRTSPEPASSFVKRKGMCWALTMALSLHAPDDPAQPLGASCNLRRWHLDQPARNQARDEILGHGAQAGVVAVGAVPAVEWAAYRAVGHAVSGRPLEDVIGVGRRLREAEAQGQILLFAEALEVGLGETMP